ncbi:MAG: hypothetical protein JST92_13185 [Deltaproteobacteria bacterium]|nr:hypothetical protein [Deltaproteobacteria bacterium]
MIRISVLSHSSGDTASLQSALRHSKRLRCDLVFFLGGLGSSPQATVDLLRSASAVTLMSPADRRLVRTRPRILNQASRLWLLRQGVYWRGDIEGIKVSAEHISRTLHGLQLTTSQLLDYPRSLRRELAGPHLFLVGKETVPFAKRFGLWAFCSPGSVAGPLHPSAPRYASGTFATIDVPSRRMQVRSALDGEPLPLNEEGRLRERSASLAEGDRGVRSKAQRRGATSATQGAAAPGRRP